MGLGLGAELPVASTYVSEFAPARMRGRLIVILEAFWAVGWTAAIIGFLVIPASDDGWRWAFALGAIPAPTRWSSGGGCPSPPGGSLRGRMAEADEVVRSFERRQERPARRRPMTPVVTSPGCVPGASLRVVVPRIRVRTACLWLVWFCVNFSYYGAFIWIPSILVAPGYDLVRSFGFTLIITLAQLPGYAVAAWLIEVWGRRITLSVFLAGSAISAVMFGTASAEWQVIATGMALSFFNLGAWGALYAVTPEMYPTSLRATGSGGRQASGASRRSWRPCRSAAAGARRAPSAVRRVRDLLRDRRRGGLGPVDRRGRALDDR